MNKPRISIIGFGRFGQTLYRLLSTDFEILIYSEGISPAELHDLAPGAKYMQSPQDAYEADTVFFAVPISSFDDVIRTHSQYFESRHVLIDVLSVKVHAARTFEKYIKKGRAQAILTHPMFGPDSSKSGFTGLPIVIYNHDALNENYDYWKSIFAHLGLTVIEMSPVEHDRIAAKSQGMAHFMGRLLETMQIPETPIDTYGAKLIHEIINQTTNDSWLLFEDLQQYNPYTAKMRLDLGSAYSKLYNQLLPDNISAGTLTIGIQGGKGSFNEEAVRVWLDEHDIIKHKVKYLYTSEKVMYELHAGTIDHGLCAIHNSIGGMVTETVEAMARYEFSIVEEFPIKISHTLMKKSGSNFEQIDTIMAHPQVFAQCKSNLEYNYPHLELISGKGRLVDHAYVAKLLSEGKLPDTIAVMGSKVLADIYNLDIIEENLQDLEDNHTSFLMMRR
jgi:prephenate dehydrogenase